MIKPWQKHDWKDGFIDDDVDDDYHEDDDDDDDDDKGDEGERIEFEKLKV